MIIHKSLARARKRYTCEDCTERIQPGSLYVRLFGQCEYDPPRNYFFCVECASGFTESSAPGLPAWLSGALAGRKEAP